MIFPFDFLRRPEAAPPASANPQRGSIAVGTLLLAGLLFVLPACEQAQPEDVVLYAGRDRGLVDPLIRQFAEQTGISVSVQYGKTPNLAADLVKDTTEHDADLFWADDAGALGTLQQDTLLTTLPDSLLDQVPARFRSDAGQWIGLSGRAHVLAHPTGLADTMRLPQSIFALADTVYAERLGWAPRSRAFQNLVTAMRSAAGHDSTRRWLQAVHEQGVTTFSEERLAQAVADDEIDFALTTSNWLALYKSERDSFPVQQSFFAEGDPGNLVDVAGVGLLASSDQKPQAHRLISYLLSEQAQRHVAREVHEYPLAEDVASDSLQPSVERLRRLAPALDLSQLSRQDSTLDMLQDLGLL